MSPFRNLQEELEAAEPPSPTLAESTPVDPPSRICRGKHPRDRPRYGRPDPYHSARKRSRQGRGPLRPLRERDFNGRHLGRRNNGQQDPPPEYQYDVGGVPRVPVERTGQEDISGEGPDEMKTGLEPQRSLEVDNRTETAQFDKTHDTRTVWRDSQPNMGSESRVAGPPKGFALCLGQWLPIGLALPLLCCYLIINMRLEPKLVLTCAAAAVTVKIWAVSRRKATIGPSAPHRAANSGVA